jgi:hypothetical protein
VVVWPGLSLAFRPAARAYFRVTSQVGQPRLDGAGGSHGLDRAGQANFRGVEGRAAAYSANGYTRNSSTGRGYARSYGYWPYAAAAAYAYGSSYASSEDGCTYVSTHRRYGTRRVLVCHGD